MGHNYTHRQWFHLKVSWLLVKLLSGEDLSLAAIAKYAGLGLSKHSVLISTPDLYKLQLLYLLRSKIMSSIVKARKWPKLPLNIKKSLFANILALCEIPYCDRTYQTDLEIVWSTVLVVLGLRFFTFWSDTSSHFRFAPGTRGFRIIKLE